LTEALSIYAVHLGLKLLEKAFRVGTVVNLLLILYLRLGCVEIIHKLMEIHTIEVKVFRSDEFTAPGYPRCFMDGNCKII
jgi:hypothetical protein